MAHARRLVLALALVGLVLPPSVGAQTALTGGQRARYTDAPGSRPDTATVNFVRDPGLLSLTNPLCPAVSTLRLSSSAHVDPAVTLDCTKWKVSGSGFSYTNKATGPGSVRSIRYRLKTLSIRVSGANYTPALD